MEILKVGEYTITRYSDGYWITNADGEGMQVFRVNFEKLIDEFFKAEF